MEPLIVAQSEAGKCSDLLNSRVLRLFCVRIEFSFSEFPPRGRATGGLSIAYNPLTHRGLLWPSPPSRKTAANPTKKASQFHDLRTLQRPRIRAALATPVGRKGDLRLQKRRPAAKILCARDVPLPVRAHPYRTCPELHAGRRAGALHARQGVQRAAPDGLGRVRAAGGERRDRAQGAAQGM